MKGECLYIRHNKNMKIKIRILGVITLTTALLIGCGNKVVTETSTKPIEFRYGYTATNSNVLSGIKGIALKQGYFEEEFKKVNAEFKPIPFVKAGPAINSALAGGELEAGSLGDVPAIVAKAQNSTTTLIDVQPSDYSTHIIVNKNSKITQVSDLKGKKVAVQVGSYMQRILFQILDKNDISLSDIEFVNMSEVDASSAIASGSIDATAVTELKGVKLEKEGSVKLIFDTAGDDELIQQGACVVRTDFAKEHPEIITAYFRALIRAQVYAKEHTEDLRNLYIESGIEADILDVAYPNLSDYSTSTETTDKSLKTMETVVSFLKTNNLIAGDVNIKDWYDGSFYNNAK